MSETVKSVKYCCEIKVFKVKKNESTSKKTT